MCWDRSGLDHVLAGLYWNWMMSRTTFGLDQI